MSDPGQASPETAPSSRAAERALTVAAVQSRLQLWPRAEDFQRQMAADISRAMQADPDLIVLPEDVGTGLAALGAPLATRARSLRGAIAAVAVRHALGLPYWLVRARGSLTPAVLLAAARRVREAYVQTFSALAREHRVHIAAGSVLLPCESGGEDSVCNSAFLFDDQGRIAGRTDKVNLIPLEERGGLHLTPAHHSQVRVWRTEIGTLGALICLDAWDRELARALADQGAQMLVVPSANAEAFAADVLTQRKQGLYARVAELAVPGVQAYAVGSLAGLGFEGRSWILEPDSTEADGVRVVAEADTATDPAVVCATVKLPRR
ncbi:MAG: nitrilase-related carbon-nitrogen hydrolase [Armatimonadota bacterium]|nr:nitrilase-related carbon-nitrogen hydrolase [Armatimonadota bacterium]